MMRVVYSAGFLKSARALPQSIQQKLSRLIAIAQSNPFHALLHTKHLTGQLAGFLSFRITRDWRVIFQFLDPGTIQLIRAAHRRDIYR